MFLTEQITTAQEYLAFERQSTERHEFIYETIIPMAGASEPHNLIAGNLFAMIWYFIKKSPQKVYMNDMRTLNPITGSYFYPDIVVTDGDSELEEQDILINPLLVIEILSPSTAVFDKTDKFIAYRSIESLQEYVLVSTEMPQIEIYRKDKNNSWTNEIYNGLDKSVHFQSINFICPLSEIYEKIF